MLSSKTTKYTKIFRVTHLAVSRSIQNLFAYYFIKLLHVIFFICQLSRNFTQICFGFLPKTLWFFPIVRDANPTHFIPDSGRLANEAFTSSPIASLEQYLNGLKVISWTVVTDFLCVHGTIFALILFIWGAVLFLYIHCYLFAYSVPLVWVQCNLHALNAIYLR